MQWNFATQKWSKYHVADNQDWWVKNYPDPAGDNSGRPTGPLWGAGDLRSGGAENRAKATALLKLAQKEADYLTEATKWMQAAPEAKPPV